MTLTKNAMTVAILVALTLGSAAPVAADVEECVGGLVGSQETESCEELVSCEPPSDCVLGGIPSGVPTATHEDGWEMAIEAIDGTPLPGAATVCGVDGNEIPCWNSYNQATFVPQDAAGNYLFWVYAKPMPVDGYTPDTGGDVPDFPRGDEGAIVNFADAVGGAAVFELYSMESLASTDEGRHFGGLGNAAYTCALDGFLGLPNCDVSGSTVRVPSDAIPVGQPTAAWAFVNVDSDFERDLSALDQFSANDPATGWYNILKASYDGYVIADWMDFLITPLVFGDETPVVAEAFWTPIEGGDFEVFDDGTTTRPGTDGDDVLGPATDVGDLRKYDLHVGPWTYTATCASPCETPNGAVGAKLVAEAHDDSDLELVVEGGSTPNFRYLTYDGRDESGPLGLRFTHADGRAQPSARMLVDATGVEFSQSGGQGYQRIAGDETHTVQPTDRTLLTVWHTYVADTATPQTFTWADFDQSELQEDGSFYGFYDIELMVINGEGAKEYQYRWSTATPDTGTFAQFFEANGQPAFLETHPRHGWMLDQIQFGDVGGQYALDDIAIRSATNSGQGADGFVAATTFPGAETDANTIVTVRDGSFDVESRMYERQDGLFVPADSGIASLIFQWPADDCGDYDPQFEGVCSTSFAPATYAAGVYDWTIDVADLPDSVIGESNGFDVIVFYRSEASDPGRTSHHFLATNALVGDASQQSLALADALEGPAQGETQPFTPVVVRQVLGDGLVASFGSIAAHDVAEDFEFRFTAYTSDDEGAWSEYEGLLNVILQRDCGAAAPAAGPMDCQDTYDSVAAVMGTPDRTITFTADELADAIPDGLSVTGLHLFVEKSGPYQVSSYVATNEALVGAALFDEADAWEAHTFSPIVFYSTDAATDVIDALYPGDGFVAKITPQNSLRTPMGAQMEPTIRGNYVFDVCAFQDGEPVVVTDYRLEVVSLGAADPSMDFTQYAVGSYGNVDHATDAFDGSPGCVTVNLPAGARGATVEGQLVQIAFWTPFGTTGKHAFYSEAVNALIGDGDMDDQTALLADTIDEARASAVQLVPRRGATLGFGDLTTPEGVVEFADGQAAELPDEDDLVGMIPATPPIPDDLPVGMEDVEAVVGLLGTVLDEVLAILEGS